MAPYAKQHALVPAAAHGTFDSHGRLEERCALSIRSCALHTLDDAPNGILRRALINLLLGNVGVQRTIKGVRFIAVLI